MNTTVMAMLLIAVHAMICVLLCVLSRVGVLRVEGRMLPFMLLVPVTAFVLDALVKGVQPTGLQVVGAVLVMGGLMLSQKAAGKSGNKSTRHVRNTVAQD